MEVIDHFLHSRHPLMLTEKPQVNDTLYCSGCSKSISGSFYGCYFCLYYLHKSCAELPRQIQNYFHPCPLLLTVVDSYYRCNACFKRGSGFSYRCESCDFDMHVECAQRPTVESEELVHHFTHWHPLKLVDPNQHLEVRCVICDSGSDSSAYCCEDCKFFVHKSCMEDIPQKINHFFHPSCPLVLFTGDSYRCEAELDHNSSWYDFHLREFSQISNWCECSHDSYLCEAKDNSCWYEFHSRERHFSNESCGCEGCGEDVSVLAFCCAKCEFVLDVKCGLLPTVESEDADKIQHSAHKHPLILRQGMEFGNEVRCRACGENCLLDPCFGCEHCSFFLHRTCAVKLPQQVHQPFHPQHPLILLSDLTYRCKGCDDYHDGADLVYCCTKCKFHLDVNCALLSTIESIDADKILHCAHKHPLVALHESMEFGNEDRCRACAKSCLAPCFGCMECNFFLHRSCAVELHPKEREIHHPFHPLHPLTLSSPPLHPPHHDTFQCSSCLGSDDWNLLRYRCAKCDFDLHIDCVKPMLSPIFKYEGHKHHLTYFDKTLTPTQCNICDEDVQTCFFRCVACSYNMHIYCIPSTPRTITPYCHLHPLTVTESPFQYELISPEYADGSDDQEFYCDVCEEKRYKFESVYYCEECKFIAQVSCVISELLPSLNVSVEHSATNCRVISRDEETEIIANIEKVDIEIAELTGEEKPLKVEIEKLRSTLKPLEEKLERMNLRLKELQIDHFLFNHLLSRNIKENEYPTEASTS